MLYMTCCWKWCSTPIKLVAMLYVIPDTLFKVALSTNKTVHHVIPDTLLKVAFNNNKTGHHVIRYTWHIIGGGFQHQLNWSPCYMLYLTHCWKWCTTPIKLVTMLYVIPDTLLKVAFNTNTTGHHVIRYTWHIVESGIQHQYNWSPCYTL
jgi:hypothetical protein